MDSNHTVHISKVHYHIELGYEVYHTAPTAKHLHNLHWPSTEGIFESRKITPQLF
jgi:hypothetical protein